MRILFLTCILYAAGAQSAFAIKAASPKEISDIQAQIFLGNRMDSKIREAEIRLEAAKSVRSSPGNVIKLEKQLAREKDKQSAARTKAIHMTILAYGLEPAVRNGTSVMPWTKGRTINWLPVAREREPRQIQSADGKLKDVKQGGDYAGITYIDGVTYMDPSAFEKGPGFLASYLLHERIHFEQFMTTGKGDAMTYAAAQKEAYQAQVDNAEYFFDPNVPTDLRMMQDIEILRDAEKAKVDQEIKARQGLKGLIRRLLPPARPPDIFESKVHTNEELADISGLVAQARSHADKAHRDREKREEILRAAAEKRAHDERLKNIYIDLARRFCANPRSVTQGELDRLPKPYETDVMNTTPRGLGECAGKAYGFLRMGASAEELRALTTPQVPAAVQAAPPPLAPVRAVPRVPVVRATPLPPLATALPRFKEFAIEACRAPDQVQIEYFLVRSYDRYRIQNDDELIKELSTGMSDCARQLFNQLIATIRAGEQKRIDMQWIRGLVTSYSYVPRGGSGSRSGGDRVPPTQDHDPVWGKIGPIIGRPR